MSQRFISGLACIVLASFITSNSQAATIGYWRFEDDPGFLQDSSGNGRHITGGPLTEGTHQSPIPGSGDGSSFPTTIPSTFQPNAFLANAAASRYGTVADDNAFTPGAFTIEAILNRDTSSSFRMFMAHWGSGTARAWGVGMPNSGNLDRLTLFLGNATGTAFTTFQAPSSAFDLALDKDYYVAVSWDGSQTGVGNNGINFYLKNLTDDTALITASLDHLISVLHNSNQPITIAANTSIGQNPWVGLVDEVRFSDSVLTIDELLITEGFVPEPSTLTLLGAGLLGMNGRRRKRLRRPEVRVAAHSHE